MVAAITHFDAAANHRERVNYEYIDENGKLHEGPGVSSDLNNGNTEKYHPIRTGYIEKSSLILEPTLPKTTQMTRWTFS